MTVGWGEFLGQNKQAIPIVSGQPVFLLYSTKATILMYILVASAYRDAP
jgi:hypothetical protein